MLGAYGGTTFLCMITLITPLQHCMCPVCGRAELQGGHGDLEPVPPLGGRLLTAAQWQKFHRGPNRPVSLLGKPVVVWSRRCTICHKKKNTPVWPVSHQSEHAAVTVFLLWLATLMKANKTNLKSTDSTGDYFPGGLISTGWHTDWCRGQRCVPANW